ncbi:MAG: sensor histidine kinase [Gemmatimonadaceae bacterium]
MTLRRHLLLTSLALILALTTAVAMILDGQLHRRIRGESIDELAREARFVSSQWTPSVAPMQLAHTAGAALGHRVTLIRRNGVVAGDSEFDSLGVAHLENHALRPEVAAAFRGGTGWSWRTSPSQGDSELYVAVPALLGAARVSLSTVTADAVFQRALRDVIVAGLAAAAIALVLAALFARSVSAPIVELRDAARAMAEGDLSRRAAIGAPGEVGDLANALHRMSEQLTARLQALQNDEALLSAVVESLNEGILAVSARNVVLQINASARGMLHVGEEVPFTVDLLPRDRQLRGALTQALSGSVASAQEVELLGRTVVVTARPLESGGAVLALSDLTKTRRLESMRRDFVANVSHELRTPLTVIGGFAETLAEGALNDADGKQFASLILSNTRRMQRIVDELLDLSRIESGGWAARPSNVDVAPVAADTFASYADTATAREVTLEALIAFDARRVYADPTALRQILGNLVENAVRHTERGCVTVFAQRDAAGTQWIGVRDSGVGIAAAHLPRIFERFYRADSARSRDSGGTGLGLAVVKHLVEGHGGEVRAESIVGRGTTISVSFPPAVSEIPAS